MSKQAGVKKSEDKKSRVDGLVKFFDAISPLSPLEKEYIQNITKETHLAKDEFWIQENKVNKRIAFIIDGYLRKYYIKEGNEVTDFFYFENSFCADLPSIIGKQLPTSTIVAMTSSHLLTFSYDDFIALCERSHTFEHIYRMLLEQTFLQFYQRTNSFILQTPKERYEELLKTHPQLLQRVTQYHVASYLGISYQHLSRLRANK